MDKLFYSSSSTALILNIIVSVGLAIVGNGVIFALDWGADQAEVQPKGLEWVNSIVGVVWIILFGLMATARWLLLKSDSRTANFHAWLVTGLIIFCWLYPFYTLGLRRIPGLIGNILTLGVAAWVTYQIKSSSAIAAFLVSTVIFWVTFATVYLIKLIQLN